eukprot:CAMPEP_0172836924 /NCGR_PEP_ID=MMETSP1075-20121228/26829_1 /TAXON_ID=2916 /ORGANISM="Ceratium fusus, Strain PA161109" /LENGTH=141 /DNA_ID=CAMNT_0013680239 /DNA_START=325 /DNA_END=746 /DNA_ORIENTATION=+
MEARHGLASHPQVGASGFQRSCEVSASGAAGRVLERRMAPSFQHRQHRVAPVSQMIEAALRSSPISSAQQPQASSPHLLHAQATTQLAPTTCPGPTTPLVLPAPLCLRAHAASLPPTMQPPLPMPHPAIMLADYGQQGPGI